MTSLRCTAALLLAIVPLAAFAAGPQTYSNVAEVEETGDVVGTKLTFEVNGETVTGQLWHYEGNEPEPMAVAGTLIGNALTLDGTYPMGKVRVVARLRNDRLVGTLSFVLSRQTNDVPLDLPRLRERIAKQSAR